MITYFFRKFFVTNALRTPAAARGRRAFSLVETTLALGVISYAMMGILGLLVVGLSTFREAITATSESQIVQSISNDILLTEQTALASRTYPYSLYFDEQGVPVEATDTARYFHVEVKMESVTAPVSDQNIANTFTISVKHPKIQAPNLYPFIVARG